MTASKVVEVLERTWEEIQARHPETPDAVIVTGTGKEKRGLRLGHYARGRWTHAEDEVAEVFLSGERLGDGPQGVLSTLLHEAAHGINHARGVKDCTRGGRYHHKSFTATARQLGLTTTEVRHPQLGYSYTECPDETYALYADVMEPLKELALSIGRGTGTLGAGIRPTEGGEEDKPRVKRSTRLHCAGHGCVEPITVPLQLLESATVHCGVCREMMEEVA